MVVQAFFYDAGGHDSVVELDKKTLSKISDQQLVWIDLLRGDKQALEETSLLLGLSPEAMRAVDAEKPATVPESFEDHFNFSLVVAPDTSGKSGRVDYLVADKWLLTVRERDVAYFEAFREQDRGESLSGRLTPAALVASLLDWHLEEYQAEIVAIQKRVDQIDSEILGEREQRPPLSKLAKLRSAVADLRKILSNHRLVIHGLLRADFSHIADQPHAEYFVALERHFDRTEDRLDQAREMIVGSFELYATRTAQDTNELVRAFSAPTDSVRDSLRGEFVIHPAGWDVEASMDGTSSFAGF
ncbi:CorA family divalent cation transporter, partial [Sphingomonas antarctica]|uniref:CorA family divalent cation transporter n=1 Tax=Sphingomonas antarctica TaxID=2040274 RepID=UPI0039EBC829